MIQYEGYTYTFSLEHEAWYSRYHQDIDPKVYVERRADKGGCVWQFSFDQTDVGFRLSVFDDAWMAFQDVPELFEALRTDEIASISALIDTLLRLGFRDVTTREEPQGLKDVPSTQPRRYLS